MHILYAMSIKSDVRNYMLFQIENNRPILKASEIKKALNIGDVVDAKIISLDKNLVKFFLCLELMLR